MPKGKPYSKIGKAAAKPMPKKRKKKKEKVMQLGKGECRAYLGGLPPLPCRPYRLREPVSIVSSVRSRRAERFAPIERSLRQI